MKKETYIIPESEDLDIRFEENILGGSTGGNEGFDDPPQD